MDSQTHSLTLSLSEPVYRYLQGVADATRQPLERIVQQSIEGNLPPSTDNFPPELRDELLIMQTTPIANLQEIALSQVPPGQQARHLELLEKNQTGRITREEKKELEMLRLKADYLMVKKAYAWALLKWLGELIPPLAAIPAD
ncbi:MAG: hypothetical protein Fur0022_40080 [Anaerolineales bacterium]